MKPTGVLIETTFSNNENSEVQRASIMMGPDTPGGFFFGVITGSERLEVPVAVEDALRFQKTKSEKVKQTIIDRYVIASPNAHKKYGLPYGGLLGDIAVGGVLEIDSTTIKRT